MDDLKPHVILIAYYFPPGREIGAFRPFRFHKYLQRMGYPCHVITANPPPEECPGEVIYVPDNFRPIWDGQSQERLSWRGYAELLIRRFFFPDLGIMWSLKAATRCRQILRAHPQSHFVVLSTFPPLGALLAGLIVRRREKVPWICDWRDPIYVDARLGNASRLTLFLNRRLEAMAFRSAAAVIANVEPAAAMWRDRYPSARQKIHVIYNGFDPDDGIRARDVPPREQKVIVHAGSIYLGRNPNLIVASLLRLRQRQVPEAASVCLHLMGYLGHKTGVDSELTAEAESQGLLKIVPMVPRQESLRVTTESDGLLLLQPQSQVQVPAKLFEYVCIGRPILAVVPRSSAVEQILKKSGVPFVCIYSDEGPVDIDLKMIEFLRFPSDYTRYSDWFCDNFNAEYQAIQLSSVIEVITRHNS